jgi:hypothetical protein
MSSCAPLRDTWCDFMKTGMHLLVLWKAREVLTRLDTIKFHKMDPTTWSYLTTYIYILICECYFWKTESTLTVWESSTISGLRNFKLHNFRTQQFLKNLRIEILTFFLRAPNFSLQEWKRNETKVEEEYCWAITQAMGRSCCGRSGSSVLELGFQLDLLAYTYLFHHMHIQLRLAQNSTPAAPCGT